MEIDLLGIDLAKRVFQLHGADVRGRAVYRNKVSRAALVETVRALRPQVIAMEACGSAHHWARRFQEAGIEVRLISPHYVSPFVKTNKNDRNDAEAIVEAASRPSMNFVAVKSVEQQDMQAAHRVRELLVQQRTAIINQARGLLGERGIAIARSPAAFRKAIPEILVQSEGELTSFFQSLIGACSTFARSGRGNSRGRRLDSLVHESLGSVPEDRGRPGNRPNYSDGNCRRCRPR
jgi:transposase